MDQLASLKAFVAVAENGGFAKAARLANMATSSVTRQVDNLEENLGVQLLNRSTRSVTLTTAGETYYQQATRILDDLEEANRSVSEADGAPRGTLRVSLPVVFARLHVAPAIGQFMRAFPKVKLEVTMSDNVVNLVEDRIDVALRLGGLESSTLIARKLAPHRRIVCASPDYLGEHGEPSHPEQLSEHNCLNFVFDDGDVTWSFENDAGPVSVSTRGTLWANNSDILREAAISGVGILLMPTWLVGDDIRAGRLKPILTDWNAGHRDIDASIHAVYLPNRRGSKKVRAFVDFLANHFGAKPYWEEQMDE